MTNSEQVVVQYKGEKALLFDQAEVTWVKGDYLESIKAAQAEVNSWVGPEPTVTYADIQTFYAKLADPVSASHPYFPSSTVMQMAAHSYNREIGQGRFDVLMKRESPARRLSVAVLLRAAKDYFREHGGLKGRAYDAVTKKVCALGGLDKARHELVKNTLLRNDEADQVLVLAAAALNQVAYDHYEGRSWIAESPLPPIAWVNDIEGLEPALVAYDEAIKLVESGVEAHEAAVAEWRELNATKQVKIALPQLVVTTVDEAAVRDEVNEVLENVAVDVVAEGEKRGELIAVG